MRDRKTSTSVFSRVIAVAVLFGASLSPAPAEAALLDQSQETWNNGARNNSAVATWQTFTPGVTGNLVAVDIAIGRVDDFGYSDLSVEIVTTAGGVPTGTVLGSATVAVASVPFDAGTPFFSVGFSPPVPLTAGTLYAIHLSSPGTAAGALWEWALALGTNPYAGGEFFADVDAADGLDDPSTGGVANSDAAFRTFMGVCGDAETDSGEGCDDGNASSGDGCSDTCQVEPGYTCVGEPSVCTLPNSLTLRRGFARPTRSDPSKVTVAGTIAGPVDVSAGLGIRVADGRTRASLRDARSVEMHAYVARRSVRPDLAHA